MPRRETKLVKIDAAVHRLLVKLAKRERRTMGAEVARLVEEAWEARRQSPATSAA